VATPGRHRYDPDDAGSFGLFRLLVGGGRVIRLATTRRATGSDLGTAAGWLRWRLLLGGNGCRSAGQGEADRTDDVTQQGEACNQSAADARTELSFPVPGKHGESHDGVAACSSGEDAMAGTPPCQASRLPGSGIVGSRLGSAEVDKRCAAIVEGKKERGFESGQDTLWGGCDSHSRSDSHSTGLTRISIYFRAVARRRSIT
jgi:hypothetical protein